MQRGVRHRHTADTHRRQACHGGELASAAHLHINAFHHGRHFFRWIFVGHGPAGFTRHKAQLALQRQAVDLVDHPVHFIRQLRTLLPHEFMELHQLGSTMRNAHLRRHGKAPGLELHEHAVVRHKVGAALLHRRDFTHTVGKERQGPLHGDIGVQLAHRARSRIARIGKQLAACGFLPLIELGKVRAAHIDLTAHFQHRGRICWQAQRYLTDGADVVGHVLTHFAIAARDGMHQLTVLVAQAHGQTIKLGLSHIFHRRGAVIQLQLATHARIKGLGTAGFIVRLGANRQHRHHMAHRRQAIEHRANHALGGRVGCDQLWVGTFERLQLLEDTVVLTIWHRRRIEHIVFMRPLLQLRTQCLHFGNYCFRSCWRRFFGHFTAKQI